MTLRIYEFGTCFIEEQARGELITLRDTGKITQQEICEKTGLSASFISDWVNRKRGASAITVSKILEALGAVVSVTFAAKKPITEQWLASIGYEFEKSDARWKNIGNDIELWQRDNGEWQICTPDANYNAIKLGLFSYQHQLTNLLTALEG